MLLGAEVRERHETVTPARRETLEGDVERRAPGAVVRVEDVPMRLMDDHGRARETPGQPTDEPRLRRVGVYDRRVPPPHQTHEGGQRAEISQRPWLTTERGHVDETAALTPCPLDESRIRGGDAHGERG